MFSCLRDFGIAERALPHRAFGAQAIFLLLLTLHKLLIMQRFLFIYIITIISGLHYFCAQVNDLGRAVLSPRRTDIPRHLGWTGGFVITSLTHAGDFDIIKRVLPRRVFGARAIFLLLLTLHELLIM